MKRHRIHEHIIAGRRLGRHVVHDPRSCGYPLEMAPAVVSVMHARRVPIYDQGALGSCTGNACAGMLSTAPYGLSLSEADAVGLYSAATLQDDVDGTYPPEDTGSSTLAVLGAAKARGWIKSYAHAYGLEQTLRALVLRPGIIGITWLEGCDTPDTSGYVQYSGAVRGGHELMLAGIDEPGQLVWMANSWGDGWGLHGYFCMSFADLAMALADNGDVGFGVP